MSILQTEIPGARVLDLYAGSGALGLEALSRGAVSADFVETAATSVEFLRRNIESLDAGALASIHRAASLAFANKLDRHAYDVAFADPPYETDEASQLASLWLERRFSAILSVEHSSAVELPAGGDTRIYGSAGITIYRGPDLN